MEAFVTFALAFSALAAPRLALDAPSVDFGEVAANDAAVMEAYGFAKTLTEAEIVAELFKRYAEQTR